MRDSELTLFDPHEVMLPISVLECHAVNQIDDVLQYLSSDPDPPPLPLSYYDAPKYCF